MEKMRQVRSVNGNPYLPTMVEVIDFYQEHSGNFTLTFSIKLKHEPGQFVQISLPGIGECPISISSSPGENLMLNISSVGNVTNALAGLKKGSRVFIRGPYGIGYPMPKVKGNTILLVGGGCGIAPLRGVIKYVERNRKDYKDLILFFGFKSPEKIIFKKECEDWKRKYNVNISVDQNPSNTCFEGKTGLVTKMLEEAEITNENKVVFLCGPPKMISSSIDTLKKKGLHDDQIFIGAERLMYCAIGRCCHCMIRGKFTCLDGPVFRYDKIKDYKND